MRRAASGHGAWEAALLPAAIEDYVATDTPVRVIDAFVDGMNISELRFGRYQPQRDGILMICRIF